MQNLIWNLAHFPWDIDLDLDMDMVTRILDMGTRMLDMGARMLDMDTRMMNMDTRMMDMDPRMLHIPEISYLAYLTYPKLFLTTTMVMTTTGDNRVRTWTTDVPAVFLQRGNLCISLKTPPHGTPADRGDYTDADYIATDW